MLADYDPNHVVHEADPVVHVLLVQLAIFRMADLDAKDLRAFAVWVLFPGPRQGQILQGSL